MEELYCILHVILEDFNLKFDRFKMTTESILFHNASSYGHFDIVKHFNIPDDNGTTPLHFACHYLSHQLAKHFKLGS